MVIFRLNSSFRLAMEVIRIFRMLPPGFSRVSRSRELL